MEILSYGLLANRLFVHNWFIDLNNPFEIVVHHLLIGGMTSFSHLDGVSIISVLICMVTH